MKSFREIIPVKLRLKYHWLRRCSWLLNDIKLPEKKFLIYCTGRSGSTLLGSLLNSHPDVFCDGEILDQKYAPGIYWPFLYITAISKKATKKRKIAYGFKLKTDELGLQKYVDQKSLIQRLNTNGWKVIHLRRKNIVNIALSQIKARNDQVWVLHKQDKYSGSKIHVDPFDLLQKINQKEHLHQAEDNCLKGIPHYKVEYESDLLHGKWEKTMNGLFTYLELSPEKAGTMMKKKSSENLADRIVNYDEVRDFLIHEGYADYINYTND